MPTIEWKKYPDEQPPNEKKVLVVAYGNCIYLKYFSQGSRRNIFYDGETHCYCPVGEISEVSHWAYLPDLPKE